MAHPRVTPYSINELRTLLTGERRSTPSGHHIGYFENYLGELGVQTIVVEYEYVDRDYLEDYSRYYARCFDDFERKCNRLHFFNKDFNQSGFEHCITSSEKAASEVIRNSYLGFIVVRPLPDMVIGRTCLRTYSTTTDDRQYPAIREYRVNLFGLQLKVSSLAFQEQDKVAAACATSALWTLFHKTADMFSHNIPTPFDITESATSHIPLESRALPNHGLTPEQMAEAIRNIGLEPYQLNAEEYVFKGTVYAYLRSGLPLLLLLREYFVDGVKEQDHTVVVVGFGFGTAPAQPHSKSGFLLRATRINRIFVHDDQIGPFARFDLAGEHPVDYVDEAGNEGIRKLPLLASEWNDYLGTQHKIQAVSDIVFLALYHKIRIPYSVVLDHVVSFDEVIFTLQSRADSKSIRLEWDIYLSTVNDLKEIYRTDATINGTHKFAFLFASLPKYIWRATARRNDICALDLLFDATGIEQGQLLTFVIEYDTDLAELIRASAKDLLEASEATPAARILEHFVRPNTKPA